MNGAGLGGAGRPVQIAAIMVVRNEASIIADAVGHLLHGLRVDRLLVADNGSGDDTRAILRRIAAQDRRLGVTDAPGDFLQGEMMTAMLEEARAEGADWVLPSDADEFLWLRGTTLQELCARSAGAGHLLEVRNFAQLRRIRQDRPGSIETMVFSAHPRGSAMEAEALVRAGTIPFLWSRYTPKILLRAQPGLAIHRGSHGADGLDGPLLPLPQAEILHAPIRARHDLEDRAEHGRRVQPIDPHPSICWHLKRLTGMDDAALEAEWRANSAGLDHLMRGTLRLDLRLARIGWRMRAFRGRALAV